MALEIKKESFSFSELFTRSKCEQAVNFEINLPDYCSDIKRILKCIVTAGVSNISQSGEAVNLSGTVTTRLVYVGENEKTDCYEHTSALSCSARINDMPENPVFRAVTKTDYINCRALSQRRISVSGNIGASVYVYHEKKMEIPCSIEGNGMQCRKEKKVISDLVCQGEKTFDLSETVALEGEREDIGKIIRSDCFVKIESKKAVADKLLVKGELCCEILYTDSSKNNLCRIDHSLPISQIISIPGITDKSDIQLYLNPSHFTVSAKNDSSGRCRLLEFGARVSAIVRCRQDKEISFITDCYSTEYEITDEYKTAGLYTCILNEEREVTGEETVEFSDSQISEIKDMWCSNTECNVTGRDSQLICECDTLVHGIYYDSKNGCRYGEKNLSFRVEIPLKENAENTVCDCTATVKSLGWTQTDGGKIKIRAVLSVMCYASSNTEKRVLYDIK
ncbi:MAG: DUF3794 domain-containing protein, partial [Clostridia bacterium]|nr:DUF3794 domain-containing protein [Clostridia bacterium]